MSRPVELGAFSKARTNVVLGSAQESDYWQTVHIPGYKADIRATAKGLKDTSTVILHKQPVYLLVLEGP